MSAARHFPNASCRGPKLVAHESMPPSLQDAVASGDVALAAKLIDASLASNGGAHASRNAAVMDRAGDIMGRTALHVAAEKGHVGMVEFLVGECQAGTKSIRVAGPLSGSSRLCWLSPVAVAP